MTIAKTMNCVGSSGKDMNDNDIYYKKCIKKFRPPLELVRHGANPIKGQPEIKQNVLNEQSNKLIQGNTMNFKDRILEETFLKKADRIIHSNDYKKLKDNIYMTRAQIRELNDEIKFLEEKLKSSRLSPQAAAYEAELQNKRAALNRARDQLDVYSNLGRKGLGVDPVEYKRDQAFKQGAGLGGLVGGIAGLGSGLYAGNQIFGENTIQKIDNLITENNVDIIEKKIDPQKILFNQLINKEKLNAGYIHTDIGHDNSFFIPKEEFLKWKEQLENPSKLMLSIEKNNPKEKEMRLRLLKEFRDMEKNHKNIDDGVVVMGTGKNFGNKPEVLAHELGHAQNHKENPYLGTLRHPMLSGLSGILGGSLIALGHPVTGGSIILSGQGGTLYDEGKASLRGYKNLKELNKNPKKGDLAAGFGSYVINGSIPAALGLYYNKRYPEIAKADDETIINNLW